MTGDAADYFVDQKRMTSVRVKLKLIENCERKKWIVIQDKFFVNLFS